MGKPILCLDFDGVCHSYLSGWKGATDIPDPPTPGMFDFLREAQEVFEVNIFSSRSHQEGGIKAMLHWFMGHARNDVENAVVEKLVFPLVKPPFVVGLDDRVLTFSGKWPSVELLKIFQPWNKQLPPLTPQGLCIQCGRTRERKLEVCECEPGVWWMR